MFKPKIIKTEKEYIQTNSRISELLDFPETDENNIELELLSKLAEDYEVEKFKIELPNPIDALKFIMEQRKLKQKDLRIAIGSKSRVSEVLNGKRKLTSKMIRNLHNEFEIPYEILLNEKGKKLPETTLDFTNRYGCTI